MAQNLDVSITCSICLVDFTQDDVQCCKNTPLKANLCILKCKHIYHPQCIQNWFLNRTSDIMSPIKRFKTCPSCRFPNNQCQHEWNSEVHHGSYLFDKFSELELHANALEAKLVETQQELMMLKEQRQQFENNNQSFLPDGLNNQNHYDVRFTRLNVPELLHNQPSNYNVSDRLQPFLRHNNHIQQHRQQQQNQRNQTRVPVVPRFM